MSNGDIVLTAGIRQNLLSLQNTASLQQTTQQRLATGKKVNSALDNAVNYFTAGSLTSRAASGFGGTTGTTSAGTSGTLTIQAADINGGVAVTVSVNAADVVSTVAANINAAAGYSLATVVGGELRLKDAGPNLITVGGTAGVVTGTGFTTTTSVATAGAVESVDQLIAVINANPALTGKIKASNNSGQLQITNLSTSALTITGVGLSGLVDGSAGTSTTGGNVVRSNLVTQFN